MSFLDFGSAVKDIFGAVGDASEASAYGKAASYAETNAKIATEAANIQGVQAKRQLLMTTGAQQAGYAGSGLKQTGSAVDALRSSMQQGALQQQVIKEQGIINTNSYDEAAAQYQGEEGAAKAAEAGGVAGGIAEGIAGIMSFSDERLKENIVAVGPSGFPGVNVYRFNYLGQRNTFEGVIAQEVVKQFPEAVAQDRDGFLMVNYDVLGVELKLVA